MKEATGSKGPNVPENYNENDPAQMARIMREAMSSQSKAGVPIPQERYFLICPNSWGMT